MQALYYLCSWLTRPIHTVPTIIIRLSAGAIFLRAYGARSQILGHACLTQFFRPLSALVRSAKNTSSYYQFFFLKLFRFC